MRFYDSAGWFNEGGTFYFADIALITSGMYSIEDSRLLREWESYENYKESVEDEKVEGTKSNRIKYGKGELVIFLLDETIKYVTKKEKDIFDVMRFMISNFESDYIFTNDILNSINEISGHDFSFFFDGYVYGTEELPLKLKEDNLDVIYSKLPKISKLIVEEEKEESQKSEQKKAGISTFLLLIVIVISIYIIKSTQRHKGN